MKIFLSAFRLLSKVKAAKVEAGVSLPTFRLGNTRKLIGQRIFQVGNSDFR